MATATATRHPFSAYYWSILRHCERTLHHWAEDECNGRIQWSEFDGKSRPILYGKDRFGAYTVKLRGIPDSSVAAMKEAQRVAAKHGLSVYNQTDPRGCALYVYHPADLKGRPIDECYSVMARAVV